MRTALLLAAVILTPLVTDAGDPPKATSLLKANSLDGWHLSKAGKSESVNWSVKDGVLHNHAKGPSLVTDRKYMNFELELEFMLPPKCNSGVYLRGRYELKLRDADPVKTKPEQRCGAIFNQIAPKENAYLGANKWNKVKVTLDGQVVTVVMNGKTVIDKEPLKEPTGGALDKNEGDPGPLMLNSHGSGPGAKFRGLTIRELP